jgi:hypothetical protein
MASIDIQIPTAYDSAVVTALQATFNKNLLGHTVSVEQVDSVHEFVVLVYSNMGLRDSFLLSLSRAIEATLSSADFSLQVSSELVVTPVHYLNGSWRM